MKGSMRTWVWGTALICVAVLGLGWLLVVSPQLSRAEEAQSQAEQQAGQNEALAGEVVSLQQQFTHLAEYQGALDAGRLRIPTQPELSDLLRQLDAAAVASSVTIISVSPGVPHPVTPVAAETPAATAGPAAVGATADGATTDGGAATASPPATPAPAGAASPEVPTATAQLAGFSAIPLSIDVVGTFTATRAFVAALQTGMSRYVLADDLTLTAQEATAADGGRPASQAGDVETVITGFAYVLSAPATGPADTAAAESPPLPQPPADRNLFAVPAGKAAVKG